MAIKFKTKYTWEGFDAGEPFLVDEARFLLG